MCKPLMTLWYDRVVALYNQGLKQNEIEPPRVFRRLFCVSHAALADSST